MGLRITTWNVNGIRNPFGYQPWRDKRTFEGMFDILEADIICFQETKIQRKDLRDDMVLVPGFDCYWSLPKHKKGYSGVVVYTRNDKCAPIRAEEGITGILTPPNSTTSFRDLPDDQQIGGYPNMEQMSQAEVDPTILDSEGRCVILEFPAFVLIGTYCPAERDETRTSFRTSFLHLLDSRIRNLEKLGKRVVWLGDINISREEIDTAMAEDKMRKNGMDPVEWMSTPSRRLFNQIIVGGKVHGDRDEGREKQIMWDICRSFHEGRKGMFTCWETKVNARPGNFGARIDYVLCTQDMKDWFNESNIQEGLMGSDHCPVYAVIKDKVVIDDAEKHIADLVNPPGMFEDGVRKQPWSAKNLLPMSGKLIPEFDKRRNIKDMFTRKPSTGKSQTVIEDIMTQSFIDNVPTLLPSPSFTGRKSPTKTGVRDPRPALSPPKPVTGKRTAKTETSAPVKKSRPSTESNGTGKGQQSLKGFFKAKNVEKDEIVDTSTESFSAQPDLACNTPATSFDRTSFDTISQSPVWSERSAEDEASSVAAKQSWGKLFAKPIAPKCDHDEPCKTMLTKKPGVNCGRSFWMCNRPLGPSGKQEKNTQWRCNMFVWCSDWDARAEAG